LHSIRSRDFDDAHLSFSHSLGEPERAVAIAMYAVRQPRTTRDWEGFNTLLKSATKEELELSWRWILLQYADFVTDVGAFVRHMTEVLRETSDESSVSLLTDILRKALGRDSQSLSPVLNQLSLPAESTP
jgi:hypothetical protein